MNSDEQDLLQQVRDGNPEAVGALITRHRERLARMVRFRLDRRIKGRISPSDVLQETFVDAARRIKEYLDDPAVPFFIWLRFLTSQRLTLLHRHHLGTKARDAAREISIHQPGPPAVSSAVLAARLIGALTSPSMAAQKAEMRKRLEECLASMEPVDREIIVLRHFERLSNSEAAAILHSTPNATSHRYFRALKRLRGVLSIRPGLSEEQ